MKNKSTRKNTKKSLLINVFDGKQLERSDFLYCIHCERTFLKGKHRIEYINNISFPDDLYFSYKMCHYSDCDGSELDFMEWALDCFKKFPDIPYYEKVYRLNA